MRPTYKPLVVACLDAAERTAGAAAFLASYAAAVTPKAADLVVASPVNRPLRDAVKAIGGTVYPPGPPAASPALRAADVVSRVARDQPARPTLVVLVRYAVFQHADLFVGCTGEAVNVASEGGPVAHDTLYREQWADLGRRRPALARPDDPDTVSPLLAAGPARLVTAYWLALAAVEAVAPGRPYRDTAPALLSAWARGWSWLTVVPPTTPWAAFGRWATVLGTVFDRGVAVAPRSGEPYAMLFDWDRVPGAAGQALWRKYT